LFFEYIIPSFPIQSDPFRREPGFVTFVKSNAKALLTLRIKNALRSPRGNGALPRHLRMAPQCSSPFEKGGRTANLNFFHSPFGRRNGAALPLSASVFREK